MSKVKIVCVTPVKNEEWILDRFLSCTSLWADHIIIADQNSNDNTPEICKKYQKVIYFQNLIENYDEEARQKLLLNKAREIPGPKLIFALDADEFITSNSLQTNEWNELKNLSPGTSLHLKWINVYPGFKKYWSPNFNLPFAFIDDGTVHSGNKIHSARIPINEKLLKYSNDIKVLHFQYTDWERMKSKHRWYLCYEKINIKNKPIGNYRIYSHMYRIKKSDKKMFNPDWIDYYENNGINMKTVNVDQTYWWDKEVLNYLDKHGNEYFKNEKIWGIDWVATGKKINRISESYKDPRGIILKLVHFWLENTKKYENRYINKIDTLFAGLINKFS